MQAHLLKGPEGTLLQTHQGALSFEFCSSAPWGLLEAETESPSSDYVFPDKSPPSDCVFPEAQAEFPPSDCVFPEAQAESPPSDCVFPEVYAESPPSGFRLSEGGA